MPTAAEQADVRQIFAEPERLVAAFHMVNRLLPEGQDVVSASPDMPAREALALMREHGYSQLPVVQGHAVLGLFSYRAFALEVAQIDDAKVNACELPVSEFLEHDLPTYARLSDEFRGLIDVLNEKDCVVVSGSEELIAILTPMDALQHLYRVANAFVLIEEIELALRDLIRASATEPDDLRECIKTALSQKYKDKLPERLEDMTFDDYVGLLRDGRNWDRFKPVFGGTRERTRARLEPVRNLRNDVFHFKRELSARDHQSLTTCRDWLLRCIRTVDAKRKENR